MDTVKTICNRNDELFLKRHNMDTCITSNLANDFLSRSHPCQCPVLDEKTSRKSIFKGIKLHSELKSLTLCKQNKHTKLLEIANMLTIYLHFSKPDGFTYPGHHINTMHTYILLMVK